MNCSHGLFSVISSLTNIYNGPLLTLLLAQLTLDLWLNFDSSICTTTPGPPSLEIGCNNNVCHAISRQCRANLLNAFLFAIPSSSITFKESFWDHFQRKCVCLCSEILLPAKKESTLTDFLSLHIWHFLKRKRPEKKTFVANNH